jgi:hypothetical protein
MNVRETSLEVYKRINDEGLLSKMRLKVYNELYKHGPCTCGELMRAMRVDKLDRQGNVWSRLCEMRDQGVVAEVDKRECTVTGNKQLVWATTNSLPDKYIPRKTKKEKVDEIINDLKAIKNTHILPYYVHTDLQKVINKLVML